MHVVRALTAAVALRFGQYFSILILVAGLIAVSDRVHGSPVFDASVMCKAIARADFSQVLDAPTQVTNALLVGTDSGGAYCRVRGYVTPNVGIELRLPAAGWNGKFLQVGCGGLCGQIQAEQCDFALRRGYACAASDMGHTSTGFDGKWAYNNLQQEVDFAYRATHVASLASKAIAQQYYGRAPRLSYFIGCSQGGRQALVEAQRFPWDFDGIVAGAPVIKSTLSSLHLLWATGLAGTDAGAPVLSPQAIEKVHEAVLAHCDRDDRIADGVVGNPRGCKFDPAELVCAGESKHSCLTNQQVDVISKLYAGATTSAGEKIYWGIMRGSELSWLGSLMGVAGTTTRKFAIEKLKYLDFMPDAGPLWEAADFDFDNGYRRFDLMESLYSASNPDLRRFKNAGGKLLMYQGWNDPRLPPGGVVDYYETVERTMGGRVATQDFARLFMLPGVGHCMGGEGASSVDYLTHIERWVEQGQPPDRIVATRMKQEDGNALHKSFPLDRKDVIFTRPVYPYPAWPKYGGVGDPNDADSFEPAQAE